MCALKCMNRKQIKGKKAFKIIDAEKRALYKLGECPSPFTVYLKHCFYDPSYIYFVLPLLTGGDLAFQLKKRKGPFTIEESRFWGAQILLGIAHMHALGIMYRDLKPENVLLDDVGNARISDMGLAICLDVTPVTMGKKLLKSKAGTPGYWPPQMIDKEKYGFEADWWAFGCCMYEFLVGLCPFSERNTRMKDRNEGTLKYTPQFPVAHTKRPVFIEFPQTAVEMIRGLLTHDRKERLGAGKKGVANLKKCEFFQDVDWAALTTKKATPPWVPPKGEINAISQTDLAATNKEGNYKTVQLEGKDDPPEDFFCSARKFYQREICFVMKLDKEGKLKNMRTGKEKKSKGGGCCLG